MSLPAVLQHLDVLQRSASWEQRLDRLGDVLDATYGGATE
jgi:hypothetical protein